MKYRSLHCAHRSTLLLKAVCNFLLANIILTYIVRRTVCDSELAGIADLQDWKMTDWKMTDWKLAN